MKDLVGIGIANAAQNPGVGQGSLEGVALTCDGTPKSLDIALEDFESAGIMGGQLVLAADEVAS